VEAGADVNAVDWAGFSPLHRAAFHGHLDCCQALLEAGANVNVQERIGGRTALHQATVKNHQEVVRLLLNKGADCLIRDWPYKLDEDNDLAREALRLMPMDPNAPDGALSYPGLTPYEIAVEESFESLAAVLQPWTEEY